jgi:hypothetical protein
MGATLLDPATSAGFVKRSADVYCIVAANGSTTCFMKDEHGKHREQQAHTDIHFGSEH